MTSAKSNLEHFETYVILVLLVIFGFSSMLFLDRFPKTWMDEAWDSTSAYTLQQEGKLRNPALVSSTLGNQDVHFLQPRIFSNFVIAPFFSALGVGNIQGRLASIFMGALAISGFYLLARKIGNYVFASTCALFFIFDNLFFVVTRTIRPEIYVTALAIWALLFILNSEFSFWKLFSAGVLLGVSLYTHPNSFLVVIAIFFIVIFQRKPGQYAQILLPIMMGGIIGFLPYIFYIWYQDAINQFQDFWLQIQHRAEMLKNAKSFFPGAFSVEIERYVSYIFFPYRLPIFLIQILAIGYALYKKTNGVVQALLIFIFVHILLFPILISAKTSRYLTVLMPMVTILVIKMVWDLAGWSYDVSPPEIYSSITKRSRNVLASTAVAMILFFNQIGGDVWAVWQSRDCSYSPFISEVRSFVPSDAKVWGPMTFWFGFYDYPYQTQWTVNKEEEMNRYQPDYVILYDNSELWADQTGVTKREDKNYKKMEATRNLLIQLAESRGTSVGAVPNGCYGNIEIFKLNWE